MGTGKVAKVVIVMPAYNAAKTIKSTYEEIPQEFRKNIILVDDRSHDNTVEIARNLGIRVFSHTHNLGYGGNQKTCYYEALKDDPSVVVMLHPDYQYDAKLIGELIRPIQDGRYDFMFGSRIQSRQSALSGGMPKIKYSINRIVCILENILLDVNFTEHFSGFRAYSVKLLKTVPFQKFSNDFVFDQQMTISALSYGFKIGEIPIPTRYHEKASSIQFLKGAKFILDTFWWIMIYRFHKLGLIKSAIVNIKPTIDKS
ncbi:MAG: glycosyltransferase family 2 protein [Candidatus Daviesbacteria bacterium]|nr:glycosyltransferase family 2 protein [Candidatus Daviesbacteria bacterium]